MRKVNADIKRIESYSGHGDYKEMIEFLKCQDNTIVASFLSESGANRNRDTLDKFCFLNVAIYAFLSKVESRLDLLVRQLTY